MLELTWTEVGSWWQGVASGSTSVAYAFLDDTDSRWWAQVRAKSDGPRVYSEWGFSNVDEAKKAAEKAFERQARRQ